MRSLEDNDSIVQSKHLCSYTCSTTIQTRANDILCPNKSHTCSRGGYGRRPGVTMTLTRSLTWALVAFLFIVQQCYATPCSCSPRVYNWTLNFNSTCSPIPLSDGLGIHSTCKILRRNLDLPVKALRLRFLEYGEDFGDIVQWKELLGPWEDGDLMTIESVTMNSTDVMPTAAAIEIDAKTEGGQSIMLQWLVDYTNACGVDPYENISNIAWMHFDNTGPYAETCTPCEEQSRYKKGNKGKKSKSSRSCERTVVKVKSPKGPKSLKKKKKNKKGKDSIRRTLR